MQQVAQGLTHQSRGEFARLASQDLAQIDHLIDPTLQFGLRGPPRIDIPCNQVSRYSRKDRVIRKQAFTSVSSDTQFEMLQHSPRNPLCQAVPMQRQKRIGETTGIP